MQLWVLILLWLLPLLYFALIFRLRQAWFRVPEFSLPATPVAGCMISVIVAARNEEKNLPALLQSLAAQDYPTHLFEIFVIDDHSTDKSRKIVQSFPLANLHYLSLQQELQGSETHAYKKAAISIAIKKSKGTLIVTTDADCVVPPQWLSNIAAYYEEHYPVMMVMPVVMKNNGSLIGIFDSMDFLTLQGITAAAVHHQLFGMCNGANLAYTRAAFDAVNGFEGIDQMASGDDMLLLQKMEKAFPAKIHYIKSKAVLVITGAADSLSGFLQQRARWSGKAGHYPDKQIMPVLWVVFLFNLQLMLIPLFSFFVSERNYWLGFWALLLLLKTIIEWAFLAPVVRFMGKGDEGLYFPFFQLPHILYTLVAAVLGKLGHYRWKGR
jgi:cellulose synthase/poly-beta-1,6-N-acetylglucosamine synthase-like glycosyltransferase